MVKIEGVVLAFAFSHNSGSCCLAKARVLHCLIKNCLIMQCFAIPEDMLPGDGHEPFDDIWLCFQGYRSVNFPNFSLL